MTVEIVVEDPRWADAGLEALAARATDATLAHLGYGAAEFEISLLACDDARVADLNAAFRGKPAPTNVLSWPSETRGAQTPGAAPVPLDPQDPELGDIAIAFDTCLRETEQAGKPFAHHVTHLLVHGTLHLLGYDHENEADAALMEALETEILGKLGIGDPYYLPDV